MHKRREFITVFITPAQARLLPQMLGKIAPIFLRDCGVYTCVRDGLRVHYINIQREAQE